ncbi:DICT sensory domain-containing protein [Geitlerinema sp. PCC 9228]|jgi:DICT domain-containing protein|uniref:DICT sensory domain-containing protein n=1 Tax=Geitlerinema sp. PCC 9228 TaxID=111611 RepID=UPI0008F993D6|nr:DICT sensory domain-containing protein [Geitlerinema sp. PCC 9228]
MRSGSILQKLAAAHQNGDGNYPHTPLQYGVYYKNTLIALCHALEDSILELEEEPIVLAAFQQGKWYMQEAERYQQLAAKSQNITILAQPEAGFAEGASKNDNVTLVPIEPEDPVAHEWHLIILSPSYTAMVLCQELPPEEYSEDDKPHSDLERKFYGFWTFEPHLVLEAMELAIAHTGRYQPQLQSFLNEKVAPYRQHTKRFAPSPDFICTVVGRVVDYLRHHESSFGFPESNVSKAHQDALQQNLVANELQSFLRMAQLIDEFDPVNPQAANETSVLTEMMGQLLDLPAWQVKRLRLAALLHRLSPLSLLGATDATDAPSCPIPSGAQVLRKMPRLQAIAKIINHQSERWDGQGQPGHLSGEEIPLESRILGLVVAFQQRFNHLRSTQGETLSEAECAARSFAECEAESEKRWDPNLVQLLSLLVKGLQQGLNLPTTPFHLQTGMWLMEGSMPQQSNVISERT